MAERDPMEALTDVLELQAMAEEELHPDLVDWVEEGQFGKMLRHPLVYSVPLMLPGFANRTYEYKRKHLFEALTEEDWHRVVFLHERPHRLNALIGYVTGRYEDDTIVPLVDVHSPSITDADLGALAAGVWVDSENIEQNTDEWRTLFNNGEGGLWLGTADERAEFDALPDPIPAWRGGIVGDWSWTTDEKVAKFFAGRSKFPVRHAMIPKADCFGYLTRRSESELLVRLTPEREPLVYPNRFPIYDEG